MIKQNQRLFNLCNKILEMALVFLGYLIATYIRFDVMYEAVGWESALYIPWNPRYLQFVLVYAVLLVLIYHFTGQFASSRSFFSFSTRTFRLMFVNAMGIVIFAALMYVTRLADFSRVALLLFYCISTLLILIKRMAVQWTLNHFREKGYNLKHVVVVGNGHLARQYIRSVQRNPKFGFNVVGYVSAVEKEGLGVRLGSYENLETILEAPGIDEVVVALEAHEMRFMRQIIYAAEKQGLKLSIIPTYNDYIPSHPAIAVIDDIKLINIRTSPLDNPLNAALKRLCDIVGSGVLLILASPFMLIIAAVIRISSPGPVMFKQERVGKNRKLFTMYKFRSMRINSSERTGWSKDKDDRKTAFGTLIRKLSLDELPQLFNVLRGDMSMVGPRPEVPYHVEHFKEEIPLYLQRQQVRPGITGWAQINGLRGDTSITERIRYDIWYIENWSFSLDFHICLKTVFGGMINSEKLVNR